MNVNRLATVSTSVTPNHRLRVTAGLLLVYAFIASAAAAQQPTSSASEAQIEQKIEQKLAKLTLEQKIDLIGGVSTWYTHAEPSIGLSPIRMSDGPAGLRSGIPAIAYPAPIALAATWNPALATRMGEALGHDARAHDLPDYQTLLKNAVAWAAGSPL